MTTYRIDAPAKINLGIEILEKRADGYHEIRSLLAAIDLVDSLSASPKADTADVDIAGIDIPSGENLILRAMQAIDVRSGVHIEIEKRIPVAAGLGGASADAAAALLIGNAYRRIPLPEHELTHVAAALGSDVPFFLGAPCARVAGTGTELIDVVPPSGFVVLFTPSIEVPRKTASLYGRLVAEDFSGGETIAAQESRLNEGRGIDPSLLGNAFTRALESVAPEIIALKQITCDAGAPFVALSGAGPSHYTIVSTMGEANSLAAEWTRMLPPDVRIHIASFRTERLRLETVSG